MNVKLAAVTPICEEDAVWIDQYLVEIERLGIRFAVHFDRCSESTKQRMKNHPAYIGSTSQDDPNIEHEENRRQGPYDIIYKSGKFDGFLIWDIDETWERNVSEKFENLFSQDHWDEGRIVWLNLWGDRYHVRTDNPSNPHRVKILNLRNGRSWSWRGQIVHPYANQVQATQIVQTEIHCIHWGLMTLEMRLLHKKRWDRIYSRALGTNPYGYWNYLLDEKNHPPVIEENVYL